MRSDPRIQAICDYIQGHLQEDLSYRHLIKQLGVKRHILVVQFPKVTGVTVTAYIIQLRLKAAMELVRQGAGLEQAAAEAGFYTYSHFYKVFVKRFGVSPRTYFAQKDKRKEL